MTPSKFGSLKAVEPYDQISLKFGGQNPSKWPILADFDENCKNMPKIAQNAPLCPKFAKKCKKCTKNTF